MANTTVYEIVTDRILQIMAKGVIPWRKPWNFETGMPRNAVSCKEYRGINVLLLGSMMYASPLWVSFKQARELGGCVRKGEHASPAVFWKRYEKVTDTGLESRFVLRYYNVFNVTQCDGITLPKRERERAAAAAAPALAWSPVEAAERIVRGYAHAPTLVEGVAQACYVPPVDEVRMPPRGTFDSVSSWYATLFHELGHSTGHASRLDRPGVTDPVKFGSHKYAREELVAEMTAAFLCGVAGIENTTLDNAAAYLAHWSARLRSEPRWIVEAAGQAQRAADHIRGIVFGRAAETDDEETTDQAAE